MTLDDDDTGSQGQAPELERQQHEEAAHVALGTRSQWTGALYGFVAAATAVFVVVGAASLLVTGDVAVALVLAAIAGAFSGVAGGVYWGGRNPELQGDLRTPDGHADRSSAVASNPPSANEHGDGRSAL